MRDFFNIGPLVSALVYTSRPFHYECEPVCLILMQRLKQNFYIEIIHYSFTYQQEHWWHFQIHNTSLCYHKERNSVYPLLNLDAGLLDYNRLPLGRRLCLVCHWNFVTHQISYVIGECHQRSPFIKAGGQKCTL